MKITLLILTSSLPILLGSCSYVGLYTSKDMHRVKQQTLLKAISEEQARVARARFMADQKELEEPQPQSQFYDIPVPAHITPQGVKFDAIRKTLKITTR